MANTPEVIKLPFFTGEGKGESLVLSCNRAIMPSMAPKIKIESPKYCNHKYCGALIIFIGKT